MVLITMLFFKCRHSNLCYIYSKDGLLILIYLFSTSEFPQVYKPKTDKIPWHNLTYFLIPVLSWIAIVRLNYYKQTAH